MKKIYYWIILILVVLLIIGLGIYFKIKETEIIVKIPNEKYTLNDISKKFNQNSKCKSKVITSALEITCKKDVITYTMVANELTSVTNSNDKDEVFKVLVDVIQSFYGSKIGDYYYLLDNFIIGKIPLENLEIIQNNNNSSYKIVFGKINDVYLKDIENTNSNTLVSINNQYQRFLIKGYEINNFEVNYINEDNYVLLEMDLYNKSYNDSLEITFYDINKATLFTHIINMKEFDNYNNKFLSISDSLSLDVSEFEKIKYYSLNIK